MSLKAGRVGVAPSQVDEFGNINSSATQGYTKQEADAKFETKTNAASTYETKTDAANLQSKTLEVPIDYLYGSRVGTYTKVEQALQGINGFITELDPITLSVDTSQSSNIELQNSHSYKMLNIACVKVQVHVINALAMNDIVLKANVPFKGISTAVLIDTNNTTNIAGLVVANVDGKAVFTSKQAIATGWYALCYTWIID